MCNYWFIHWQCYLLRCRYYASDTDSKTSKYSANYFPTVPLCPSQMSHGLPSEGTRSCAMTSCRLSCWPTKHFARWHTWNHRVLKRNKKKEMYGTTDLKIARQIKVRKDINRSLLKNSVRIIYTTGSVRVK